MIKTGDKVVCSKNFWSKYPELNEGLPNHCPVKGDVYTVTGLVFRHDLLNTVGLVIDGFPVSCPEKKHPSIMVQTGEEIGWWSKQFTNLDGSKVDVLTDEEKSDMELAEKYEAMIHRRKCRLEIARLRANP